jgi:hypothetical protein
MRNLLRRTGKPQRTKPDLGVLAAEYTRRAGFAARPFAMPMVASGVRPSLAPEPGTPGEGGFFGGILDILNPLGGGGG